MQRVITSNSITFMDTSDERKLELSIESNLPTSQLYNSSTGAHSPDWTTKNLVLEACATLDLIDVTQNKETTIKWSKKNGTGDLQAVGTGYRLTVSTNELSEDIYTKATTFEDDAIYYSKDSNGNYIQPETQPTSETFSNGEYYIRTSAPGIITYICTATYDGITVTSQMVFSRVDSGKNGVLFQIYGEQGLVLTKDVPFTFLKVFAYDGNTEITDATYKWYYQGYNYTDNDSDDVIDWTPINIDSTEDSYEVNRTQIFGLTSYKCEMIYKGETYCATAVVQDKNDIYNAFINVFDTITDSNGKHYAILYPTIYSADGEVDILLGPIFDKDLHTYIRYADDENGTNMSTDPTGKLYAGIIYDGSPSENHVDYIWKKYEAGKNLPFYCYWAGEYTDSSGNVSIEVAPLQIKSDGGGSQATWDYIDATTQSTHSSQIYNYKWNVGERATPTLDKVIAVSTDDFADNSSNVICEISDETGVIARTSVILKSTLQNQDDTEKIKKTLDIYTQSVSVNSDGITITAIDSNNNKSPFSSRFTSSKLAFLYDESSDNKEYIETESEEEKAKTKLKITANGIYTPNIDVKETIQLGGLKFIIEDNGSYSITV